LLLRRWRNQQELGTQQTIFLLANKIMNYDFPEQTK